MAQLAGLGKAAELARHALLDWQSVRHLRDDFEQKLLSAVDRVELNGSPVHRLPNTTHASFEGVDAGDLLVLMDEAELCCSSGSACSTGAVKPSHVMLAMGHSEARAKSSLRFSVSRYNTAAEVDTAVENVAIAMAPDPLPIVLVLRATMSRSAARNPAVTSII